MKICISATGNNLDAPLDPRFGRAMYFLIVDDKGKLIKAIKNTGVQAMRGAGITAAQIVAAEKVNVVITGNIGPNASMVLGSSGIKIFLGSPGMNVRDVFQEYQKGKLREATESVPCGPGFGPGFGQRGKGLGGRGRGRR
ncbi:MAG: NifB/NifX family molybdenum-iron cluster-binding protein [Candidatus Nealsonbacteria bacterium]